MAAETAPRTPPRSHLLLGIVIGLIVGLVLAAILFAPIALTHHSASGFEEAYGNAVVGFVARRGGVSVGPNPVANDARAVQHGRDAFLGACSPCHGPAGNGKGLFGTKTFPPATNLTSDDAKRLSDDQLVYIIKNGLGFTPMPAYGGIYSNAEIWSLVAYVRALQSGQAGSLDVPTPTSQQRSAFGTSADGSTPRGALLWFAEGCSTCHGNAPGKVVIGATNPELEQVIRNGREGMPCFPTSQLSDADLKDVEAYLATVPWSTPATGAGQRPPAGGTAPAEGSPTPSAASASPCTGSTGKERPGP